MRIEAHPGLRIARHLLGDERTPLLVVDQVAADPEALARRATRVAFAPEGAMFPGIRAKAPLGYQDFLERLLLPLLGDAFGLQARALRFPLCHWSLVTRPPERLSFLQRVPHIDSTTTTGLATVHYLFRGDWGGTAFYRHRATGFERVDEARRVPYFERLQQESRDTGGGDGYIDGDTALFERLHAVDGAWNRMVVYPRNLLHSGRIDNARLPPPDVVGGRLSINTFIDLVT